MISENPSNEVNDPNKNLEFAFEISNFSIFLQIIIYNEAHTKWYNEGLTP